MAQPAKPASPLKLEEQRITKAVRAFLVNRGWRAIRFQRFVAPGSFQTGEPGIPDYLFVRYFRSPHGAALAMWIEMKAPMGRFQPGQQEWHQRETQLGASVWVVDDVGWFAEEYERIFGWLHSGPAASGQLDLLAGL